MKSSRWSDGGPERLLPADGLKMEFFLEKGRWPVDLVAEKIMVRIREEATQNG